ncbi:MAG: molybdopterin-dependent oxidoreductase [Ilumatobacter sp.]|uniref:molybdopterin-containing oxidoreductase family protein n=1 Tax=Ilumatobacter sp. TaxID=1967498 RepID=UPI002612C800|nr:molybdopterin-dependent oxidoreductase [Ilumatobacter sp.]MDJ0771434.1 molybdopterin-dependent oxidoreductase [Ilumatobacter sp.]
MADPTNGTHTVNGICHHDCPDSCGWTVTVEGDGPQRVAVKMRGNPEHPYSYGELCPKVNRFLDRVYSPDRVLRPLRRTGPKGSGEFEPISWDEALDEIGSRLNAVIDEHGGEAVMPFSDAGNQSILATQGISSRLFHHIGATRLLRNICGPTVAAGAAMTNGTSLGGDAMDLEHAKLIILWATNTRLTNRHLWPVIEKARANGARLVVIDPIRTITAEEADWFVQPLPGTDTAMMLAMMHVIIRDDLLDHEWVEAHTLGLDELAEAVAAWTPARAAEQCGVDADVIERLAREYATTRPAAIRTLVGGEHHENGAMFYRTMACLPALTGAWRDRGGGFFRSVGTWQDELIDEAALTRPDLLAGREVRTLNMSRLGEILLDEEPPVRAMIVWNSNPLVIVPNAERVREGLDRDDLFTVVHEQFVTDTARYADIVLPATTHIEASDVSPAWGHLWMGWNEAAIEPLGEAVSNSECFRRIAGAMGLTEPSLFEDDLTVLRAALPAVDLDRLRADGWMKVPFPESGTPWANGGFPTASGRVELASDRLEAIGQPRVPTFVPPVEGPHGPDAARFPLQLMTPKHHTRFLNSSYSQLPKHGPAEGGPFVELDAVDAAARGLAEGDAARVFNDRASVEVPVKITERLRPGVASIPWGWWRDHHPDGKVANSLTNDTLTEWGGGVAYSDTLVEVERA